MNALHIENLSLSLKLLKRAEIVLNRTIKNAKDETDVE